MLPDPLKSFLRNYLAAEGSQNAAVRKFTLIESEDQVWQLITAIREVFGQDVSEGVLKDNIERAGNVQLPAGTSARQFLLDLFGALSREAKLQRRIKAYDIFVSYSSQDQALGTWLASELRNHGYSVWLDHHEILVGQNIIDKVYQGIVESEFLVVLLTKQSVQSKWVKEELTATRLAEIQNARVTVLPVKCEADVEIPALLRVKRLADMSADREEGLRELMRAIDLYRGQVGTAVEVVEPPVSVSLLRRWYEEVKKEPMSFGFDTTRGYKDVVVGSPDSEETRYDKRQLQDLLERTRVRVKGWGGAPFPYEHTKAQPSPLPDGLRLVDPHTWVFSEWNFHYWRFTEHVRFFQRTGLYEDGDLDATGRVIMRGSLNVIWVIKDVCTALTFAANLLREVNTLSRLAVIQRLCGMGGRRLAAYGMELPAFGNGYVAGDDTIEQVSVVTRNSNLQDEAFRVLAEIFWLFSWRDFPEEWIKRDTKSFLAGRFPPRSYP